MLREAYGTRGGPGEFRRRSGGGSLAATPHLTKCESAARRSGGRRLAIAMRLPGPAGRNSPAPLPFALTGARSLKGDPNDQNRDDCCRCPRPCRMCDRTADGRNRYWGRCWRRSGRPRGSCGRWRCWSRCHGSWRAAGRRDLLRHRSSRQGAYRPGWTATRSTLLMQLRPRCLGAGSLLRSVKKQTPPRGRRVGWPRTNVRGACASVREVNSR